MIRPGQPVAVTCFYVRRPHFGQHSGIQQFIRYLDPSAVRVKERPVSDSDEDMPRRFPWRSNVTRKLLRATVRSIGPRWYKLSDFEAELANTVDWWRGESNVLHFIDGEHTANLLPLLASHLRNRGRTVATYHQTPALLPRVVSLSVASRLDHITVVSSTQRGYFEQVLPASRVSVILHGIDTTFFHPVAKPAGRVVRCLTVGSYLRDWPLLGRIARAFTDDASVTFDIVSSAVADFNERGVTLHRRLSDDGLRDLYHRADIVLLPVTDATANNALLEGMASGLPIVATDLPSMREYAGGAGVLVPHDLDAFVTAIRALRDDPDRRKQLGSMARAQAERLSWQDVAPRFTAIYETVALAGKRS